VKGIAMNIGVVFPQTEYSHDPADIRDYAQTAEGLGFSHIVAYDHILGANPNRPGGWQGPYTYQTSFFEPFILFSYLAGITKRIGFTTSIIILPQRQTALVAKQTATLDVLCGGRLRLGIGLGWNDVEYISLGEDFHTRGRRVDEQVAVLQQLWTQPLVDFKGQWHTIPDAGINPLPIQRPIPIWFGGHAEPVLKRAARMGNGWMPNFRSAADSRQALEILEKYLVESGKPRDKFGIEARIPYGEGKPEVWHRLIREWQAVGATHFSVNTMGYGFNSPSGHLKAIQTFAASVGLLPA
jgi:probable F420-dependent oxidoreductase